MQKPHIGAKLKARRLVGKLKRNVVYTVTAVQLPYNGSDEQPIPMSTADLEAEGYWWVKTDKTGDEWYALSHFRPI